MQRWLRSFGLINVLGLGLTVAACGDGTSTVGPGGVTIASLAGNWTATSIEWATLTGSARFDLIADGGSGTLVIQTDGRFTLTTIESGGLTEVTTGSLVFNTQEEDFLVVRADGEPEEEFLFFLSGNMMSLRGDDTFDFDDDGVEEPATIDLMFTRN